MTWLIAAFLIAHGAVHLAVWLPPPPTDAERQAPFAPDHSAVLTRTQVPQTASHLVAVAARRRRDGRCTSSPDWRLPSDPGGLSRWP